MTVTAKKEIVQPVSKKTKEKEQEVSFKESLVTYFKGVRSEWNKVTWPDKQQLVHETLVVLGVTIFMTLLIYVLDNVINFTLHPGEFFKFFSR